MKPFLHSPPIVQSYLPGGASEHSHATNQRWASRLGPQSTQPPHPLRIVDVPSGYSEDLETFGTPDTVDITDILSVDVTPQASGAHVQTCLLTLVHLCLPILMIV